MVSHSRILFLCWLGAQVLGRDVSYAGTLVTGGKILIRSSCKEAYRTLPRAPNPWERLRNAFGTPLERLWNALETPC
ncbi:hypothetical protein HOY80DRAFT_961276 [Tuber brumale]|nr:hypothetical protein HOY80DRAFT_961276 [Tuber brumale]